MITQTSHFAKEEALWICEGVLFNYLLFPMSWQPLPFYKYFHRFQYIWRFLFTFPASGHEGIIFLWKIHCSKRNIKNTVQDCWQKVRNNNTNKTRKTLDLRGEIVGKKSGFSTLFSQHVCWGEKKGVKAVFLAYVFLCTHIFKKNLEPSRLKKVVFSFYMTRSGHIED